MSITHEAVESAKEAMREITPPPGFTKAEWVEAHGDFSLIAGAIAAAAPHLMAQAFDEGQKSGMRHADRLVAAAKIGHPELPGPISPNPYRKDAQ